MLDAQQARMVEEQAMGVRVVDDGGTVISGSYYLLYPVEADWPARLAATCRIISAASQPGKRLHFLINTPGVVSGTFKSDGQATLNYGRLVGNDAQSVADAGLYGTENPEAIRGFIIRNITIRAPAQRINPAPDVGPPNAAVAAFSSCCTQIAWLFSCCNPAYRRLREEDEFDLT